MKRIIQAENINSESKLINARRKHESRNIKKPCDFRIYTINSADYTAKGIWAENGIIYKDKIKFRYYSDYISAKKQAYNILNNTSEIAVSIEDVKKNILYIVYKDKIQILRIKYTVKTPYKRTAIIKGKAFLKLYGGYTIEKANGQYKITSYK